MQNTFSQSGNDSKWFLTKIIFQNRYVALKTPSRPPPFMANAILNFHFDFLNPSLTFTFSYLGTAEESLELKHVRWQWKILIRSQQTSSPDLHRGTPCWSVVAPRYCRRLVWGTLSSGGERGTSRGSWFGPQDINWSDRLPYLLLTITYRHWNFFFATNSLPPQ